MTSRNQKKIKNTESLRKPTVVKRVENSWILLLQNSLLKNDNFSIITLPHPANGAPAKYCLDDINTKIYEVILYNEPYRSWFINETVKSDGNIQILTPINPLFLVLPLLKKQCTGRAIPLEDLLAEKNFAKIVDYVYNLDYIGDAKGSPDMKAYKYNEEKALAWLEGRVRKLAKVLREKNIHVTSGVASATFIASNINNASIDDEFFLKYANGIISEYLEDDLANMLEKRFEFKSELIESLGKKRKSDKEHYEPNKKVKNEPEDKESMENLLNNSNSNTEVKKPKTLNAKEKARQRAACGTKTISAFFSKK